MGFFMRWFSSESVLLVASALAFVACGRVDEDTSLDSDGGVERYIGLVCGSLSACAQREDGTVECWGTRNLDLQEGHGVDSPPSVPLTSVAVGYLEACGLEKGSGELVCWGARTGLRTLDSQLVGLTAGRGVVCGLDAEGAASCWGWPRGVDPPDPIEFPGTFRSLSIGSTVICGLTSERKPECIFPDIVDWEPSPEGVAFATLEVADWGACGLSEEGQLYCWGSSKASPSMVETAPTEPLVEVHVRDGAACGRRPNGTLVCWGSFLQFYESPLSEGAAPVPSTPFETFCVGDRFGCGLKADGSVECWGDDRYGAASPPRG